MAYLDPKTLDDKKLQEYINYFSEAASRDSNVAGGGTPGQQAGARINLDTLQRLKEEQIGRQQTQRESQGRADILNLFGGGGGAVPAGPTPQQTADAQRAALDAIFQTASQSGQSALDKAFAADRGRAIEEAAATGNLRQPGFLTSGLGDIDARRADALKNLFLGLETERAKGKLGVESDLADQGFREKQLGLSRASAMAGLLQGGEQFGQTFGLEQAKFGEAKRRSTLEDLFNRDSLAEAERVGKAQADAAKPGFLDDFAKITGGVGSILGGVGALRKPKVYGAK